MKNQMSFLLKRNMRVVYISLPIVLILVYLSTGYIFKPYPPHMYMDIKQYTGSIFRDYFLSNVPLVNVYMAIFSIGLALLLFYKEKFQSSDTIYYTLPIERKILYLSNILTGISIIFLFSTINGASALMGYNIHKDFLQAAGLGINVFLAKIMIDFLVYLVVFLCSILLISIINKLISGLFFIFTTPFFLIFSTVFTYIWAIFRLFGEYTGKTDIMTNISQKIGYYHISPGEELYNVIGYNLFISIGRNIYTYANNPNMINISDMTTPNIFWKAIILLFISVLVFLLSTKLLNKFKLEDKSKLFSYKSIENTYRILFTISVAVLPNLIYLSTERNVSLVFADILFIVCLIAGFIISSLFIKKSCVKPKLITKMELKIFIGCILFLIVLFISFRSYPYRSTSNVKDEIKAFDISRIEEAINTEGLLEKFTILNPDLPGKEQMKTIRCNGNSINILYNSGYSIPYGAKYIEEFENKYWKEGIYSGILFNSIVYFSVFNDIDNIYYQIEAGNDDFQTKISRVMIEKAFEIDDMNSRKIIPDSIKKAKLVMVKFINIMEVNFLWKRLKYFIQVIFRKNFLTVK
jgi:hypothetical protein